MGALCRNEPFLVHRRFCMALRSLPSNYPNPLSNVYWPLFDHFDDPLLLPSLL